MKSSPLDDLVIPLTNLHQTQHQALLLLRHDQEQKIKDLLDAPPAIPAVVPAATVALPHIALVEMGPQDDPEAFLELY